MIIQDNIPRKMLIQVDTNNITPESARKLNKILSYFEMKLTEDGWYTGTNDHCRCVQSLIVKNMDIFRNLKQWILWNPETNSKENCIDPSNLEGRSTKRKGSLYDY